MADPLVEAMKEEQYNRCAICSEEKPLVVDHCHETGEIRGLLCSACNTALGLLNEDPRILHSATYYVLSKREVNQ